MHSANPVAPPSPFRLPVAQMRRVFEPEQVQRKLDGLAERDRHVFTRCREHGTPAAIAMAGGYARNIDDTVRIHATTIRLARCAWT